MSSERAAELMTLLGLSEDELCQTLDVDPLTVLSGQLDHRPELEILITLVEEASEQAGAGVLKRWVRANGPAGRPVDLLVRRDFAGFEDALAELGERGFVLRGGTQRVGEPLRYELRVRYGECDMQGVVFNANYLAYFDNSVNELVRAACGNYKAMLDRGVDIVVGEAQLRFRSPARFDEQLTLEIAVSHLGTTSIVSEHRIRRDGEVLVEGTVRHVMVDAETLSKTPIPDWLRAQLGPWTVEGGS